MSGVGQFFEHYGQNSAFLKRNAGRSHFDAVDAVADNQQRHVEQRALLQ